MSETVLENPIGAMSSLGYDAVPLYFLNMVRMICADMSRDYVN
jgi:hypothetical protein